MKSILLMLLASFSQMTSARIVSCEFAGDIRQGSSKAEIFDAGVQSAVDTNEGTPDDRWPACGMNINAMSYYLSSCPYTDAVKVMRWIAVGSWDERGYPTSAKDGEVVTARTGVNVGSTWPSGEYVLTWDGNGDVIVNKSNVTLVSEDLSSNKKRRVYNISPDNSGIQIQVNSYPATNVHLYLPGLENHSSMWNPEFIKYLKPFEGSVLRVMNLMGTNSVSQVDWSDRTPPDWSSHINLNDGSCVPWANKGKSSFESMIELCNEVDCDIWICVHHTVTDDYLTKLANLIKTGIDQESGERTCEPLNVNRRVWIEYSNEVWNTSFKAQTNWVKDNPDIPGDNIDEKYANKAVGVFNTFRAAVGDNQRVLRILSTHTVGGYDISSQTYKRIHTVNYPDDFDALSLTTYFNYGTGQYLYDNWPVSENQLLEYLTAQQGGNGAFKPSDTNKSNEQTYWSYKAANDLGIPVVSYEGNEHLNPVMGVDTNGDGWNDKPLSDVIPGATDLIHSVVRRPEFIALMEANQQKHEASGLRTHVAFDFMGSWSKYGQFAHVEYLGQPLDEAVKYKWLLDHFNLNYPDLSTSSSSIPFHNQPEFMLYPNPVKKGNFINIKMPGKNENTVSLLDINGKILLQDIFNKDRIKLSTDFLGNGIYVVQINNKSSQKVLIY